jgi:hypothetical protein
VAPPAYRWVIIETGSNQDTIFATDRQRLQLATSHAIGEVGTTWIDRAINEAIPHGSRHDPPSAADPVRRVVRASGLGILLVLDPETGRSIVESVTRKALTESPGIDVWGVVGAQEFDPDASDGGAIAAFDAARLEHAIARMSRRRPPSVRAPASPFVARCVITDRPATHLLLGEDDGSQPVAASVAASWDPNMDARKSLVEELCRELQGPHVAIEETQGPKDPIGDSILSQDLLRQGADLTNEGWYGVLHADGNAIGQVFANLWRTRPNSAGFIEAEGTLSGVLERLIRGTVANAIARVWSAHGEKKNWIVPIIVGGDDLTAVISGSVGFEFAVELAREFDALTAEGMFGYPLAQVMERINAECSSVPDRPSLGVGLAFAKPHHPFSHALQVANDLTDLAKSKSKRQFSALGVHVINERSLRSLNDLRAEASTGSGPSKWCAFADPIAIGRYPGTGLPELTELDELMKALDPRWIGLPGRDGGAGGQGAVDQERPRPLTNPADHYDGLTSGLAGSGPGSPDGPLVPSKVALHALRRALTTPTKDVEVLKARVKRAWNRVELAQARSPKGAAAGALQRIKGDLAWLLDSPRDAALPLAPILLVTAMDLVDVASGTVEGAERADKARTSAGGTAAEKADESGEDA